jgi:hypothetical protein
MAQDLEMTENKNGLPKDAVSMDAVELGEKELKPLEKLEMNASPSSINFPSVKRQSGVSPTKSEAVSRNTVNRGRQSLISSHRSSFGPSATSPEQCISFVNTATKSRVSRGKTEREVLVGTPVKEGHHNYMLMYDMLTGIRISVSRCYAKPHRELVQADFEAAHKLAFDV